MSHPPGYGWFSDGQRDYSIGVIRQLVELVDGWERNNFDLKRRSPKPDPEIRIMPRV